MTNRENYCPNCGAKPAQRCTTKSGKPTSNHRARNELAAIAVDRGAFVAWVQTTTVYWSCPWCGVDNDLDVSWFKQNLAAYSRRYEGMVYDLGTCQSCEEWATCWVEDVPKCACAITTPLSEANVELAAIEYQLPSHSTCSP